MHAHDGAPDAPIPPPAGRDPDGEPISARSDPERAQATALAEARVVLATAVLAESEGVAACWRVLETSVHRRHWSRRALLLERPVPRWIEAHIDTLHTDVGCHWEPLARPPERRPALAAALARLPWSGEWLVHVSTTLPASAAARVEPLAAAWVGHRNAFVEQHRGLVVFIARRRRGRL